jgi:hypothetical protein
VILRGKLRLRFDEVHVVDFVLEQLYNRDGWVERVVELPALACGTTNVLLLGEGTTVEGVVALLDALCDDGGRDVAQRISDHTGLACERAGITPRPRAPRPPRVTAKARLGHFDWFRLFAQLYTLKAWKDAPHQPRVRPKLCVRWGTVAKHGFVSGHAHVGGNATITIGPDSTLGHVAGTILHEMTHLYGYWKHNAAFRTALNAAAIEAFVVAGVGDWSKQAQFDARLDEQINMMIPPEMIPVKRICPPLPPAERRAALVERRHEHARAALERHEAKLRRQQKLVKKWKAKVNGYERRAAAKRAPRDGEGS